MNQLNTNVATLAYRAEIDGLRAIAVIAVVLYHAQLVFFGNDWFEGGYIGVDVFSSLVVTLSRESFFQSCTKKVLSIS